MNDFINNFINEFIEFINNSINNSTNESSFFDNDLSNSNKLDRIGLFFIIS
jgi:hypothetical protein